MKKLIFFFLFIQQCFASAIMDCPTGQMRAWTQSTGYFCVNKLPTTIPQNYCTTYIPNINPWMQSFPSFLTPQVNQSWWAQQGNYYYPNMYYPGAWNYPYINSSYYSGQGQVFAAKPNVYIESIHAEKKFQMKFTSEEKLSFLATTPVLEKNNIWKGKIISKDKFEVDDVYYDYLFYDIRLPKEKMQFEHGVCATREGAIEWMLKDLKELKYSAIALQDFEEHWRVKIPDYPYYCIYPQYNEQLDAALPVSFEMEQASFTRSLYVLIPHKTEPDMDETYATPLPMKDPETFRPSTLITRENMFKEWGVAFLGE